MTIENAHTENIKRAYMSYLSEQRNDPDVVRKDYLKNSDYIDIDISLSEALDLMVWVFDNIDPWPDREDTRVRPYFSFHGNEWVAQGITEYFEEAPEDPGYFDRKVDKWVPTYNYLVLFDETNTNSPLEAVLLTIDAIVDNHPEVIEG